MQSVKMGNKFSFGDFILYCGFPHQRRRVKDKAYYTRRRIRCREGKKAFNLALQYKFLHPELYNDDELPIENFPYAFLYWSAESLPANGEYSPKFNGKL